MNSALHSATAPAGDVGRALVGRWRSARRWRLIPQLDTDPRVVAFAETVPGRVALLAAFGALLIPVQSKLALATVAAAAACAYAPAYRRWVVAAATLVFLLHDPSWYPSLAALAAMKYGLAGWIDPPMLQRGVLALFLLLSLAAIRGTQRYRRQWPLNRPILCLLALYGVSLLVAASSVFGAAPQVVIWSWVGTFGAYFWFLCYAVRDVSKDRAPPPMQLGVFHPFWGSSTTPIGKGWSYLRKVEAPNAHELAITQLKGLKLLAWSQVLWAVFYVFQYATRQAWPIPTVEQTLVAQVAGAPFPWYLCWLSLVCTFLGRLFNAAIWGNVVVACARLAGFRLLRYTYRPLESRTVAEFWNRYLFYFKELLVEFFFYPTFIRCFRGHPRLRLFFATFMAACVGNVIWHFMRDVGAVLELGLTRAVVGFQTFAFYAAVLAIGIAASQLNPRKGIVDAGWLRGKLLPCARVLMFFCVLEVFDDEGRTYTLVQHFGLLFHLFGVRV
ncbi:MAG: hypothetical protein KGL11_08975 [Alphaproteobacteria bacterium]|nr:hypothetical protein [Alphaproteobacteria bacterium]